MAVSTWSAEALINNNITGNQTDSSVAALKDGGFVVVWTDYDSNQLHGGDGSASCIKMQRYDAAGQKVGDDEIVNSLSPEGVQQHPDVAVLEDGSFIVVWEDGFGSTSTDQAIGWKQFSADGQPLSDIAHWIPSASVNFIGPSVVAKSDGGFAILVDKLDANGHSVFNYDSDGNPDGVDYNSTSAFWDEPELAFLSNGQHAVAYDNDSTGNIEVRVSQADGSIRQVAVSQTAMSSNSEPAIVALKNGGFVVTWTDESQTKTDNDQSAVFGRVFDNEGNALGAEFQVNQLVTGYQNESDLVALPSGGFAVVYYGFSNIRGSIFDASGQRVGGEFNVNTDNGTQNRPSIDVLADGRLVFTWTDMNDGTGDGDQGGVVVKILDPRDGSISGTDYGETIYGSVGDVADTISGLGGGDTIHAGEGNDIVKGGLGADHLNGGDGIDTASYANATSAVVASLANPSINSGEAADDTYASIENLVGSAHDDAVNGDNAVNVIRGRNGQDTIKGYGGDDTLHGDDANDVLIGGTGADTLIGGAGSDTASYAGAGAGVIASLANPAINSGDADGDSYSSIENLTGSSFDDSLFGDNNVNVLSGGGGADVFKSYGGNDTVTGGAGADIFVFNAALDAATNVDTITDYSVAGDTIHLENGIFTALIATGALAASAFKDIAVAAKDANDRIIYNSDTGALYYDADGSGAAFGNVKFATLSGEPGLTAADFVVI
ncbi:calcium-binding protein [Mesorhizobium sp. IMUNJ 23232]|uniref:calcium-binding protein n=1 Tax=Mesorhizobium sp. IMUNJ 23232 TaxID=3376064 RepID=UPI0037BC772C